MAAHNGTSTETLGLSICGFVPIAKWRRTEAVRSPLPHGTDKKVASGSVSHNTGRPNLPVCALGIRQAIRILRTETDLIWYKCDWGGVSGVSVRN